MNLIHLTTRTGKLCLPIDRIVGVSQNRIPTETPTRVLVDSAPWTFDVRDDFASVTERLEAAESTA